LHNKWTFTQSFTTAMCFTASQYSVHFVVALNSS
jgi:hypothetical protein